ncbi:MAG: hypothetical protein LBE25_07930 [Arthrobacter sp.]|jgi:hypothetical protein|nr:hypothetical protein [Arthrobacter sp.]
MTAQTPGTEQAHDACALGSDEHDTMSPDQGRERFDAWLAAHDRKVAVRALREAANPIGGNRSPRGMRMADEVEWAQWLNDRSDHIEAGGVSNLSPH